MPHKKFLERIVECPSCHSIENMKNKQTKLADDVYQYEVYCEKCNTLHVVGVGPTKDRALTIAIKDWNSKVSPSIAETTIKQPSKSKTVQNKKQSQSLTKPKISFDISLLEKLNKDEIVSLSKYLIRKFSKYFKSEPAKRLIACQSSPTQNKIIFGLRERIADIKLKNNSLKS